MTGHTFRISAIIVSLLLSGSLFAAISSTGSDDRPEATADTITFAAGGDHTGNSIFQSGLDKLAAAGTDFYVAVGDLGFTGVGNEQSWCNLVKSKMGDNYPFQLLSGNHDEDGRSDGWIGNYVSCLPDHTGSVGTYGGQYYFDYPSTSPLVRVILLPADITVWGTYRGYSSGSAEYAWTSNTIDDARVKGIPWIVVAMHKVCITTGTYSCSVGTDLYNMLLNKKVDLIVHGHVHTNERSKQLTCVTENSYNPACVADDGSDNHYVKGAGSIIIIGGPMGQGVRSVNPGDPEAGYFAKIEGGTYGFYKYTVTATRMDAVYNAIQGSHSDSFTIGPNDQPFTVNLNPKSDSANPGEVVASSVQVNGVSAVPVTLSSSGCPPNASCSVSPSSGAAPFTATLTITTSATTPLNTYPIIVTGTNGTRTDSDTFTLTVDQTVTRTYQKGDGGPYSEIDDTYIFDGAPNANYGSNSKLYMDTGGCDTGGNVCKTLIKFPNIIGTGNGQIPPGVIVKTATLEFMVTDIGSVQNVHQVTESWQESTATWNSFANPGSPGAKPIAGSFTPASGRMSIDITGIVQNWANGELNEGILFNPTAGDGVDLDSSESVSPEKLTVVYEPIGSNNFPSLSQSLVSPSSGTTTTSFTYQVKYSDSDNDAPAAGHPKVHISKGGTPISGSPFSMARSSWVGAANDYVQGAIYTYARQFVSLGLDYSYYFTANDLNGAGASTSSQDAPDVTNDGGSGPSAGCMRIAIPSYFYPGALWDQAIADAPATSIMIMNPSNGPGTSYSSAYGNAVSQAKAAGIKVLGYVYTQYGVRTSAVVKADIDSYMNWYGVDGIFLDEVSNDAADIAYYQEIANHIRTKPGKFIMINPGTSTDEQYMSVADVVTVFESSYSSYLGATFPSWMSIYPPSRFLHLVYETPQASFANAWDLAKARNAGYVYITDDTISNPWDSLPAYWDSEVAASDDSCSPADNCVPSAQANGGFITAQNAQLQFNGQRIKIVGANSYGILSEYLGAGHVTDLVPNALQRFQEAKNANLNVMRFWLDIAPSDYWWGKSYGVYKSQADHSTYFAALDSLIADAEANGIRIVPVFASAFDQWTAEGAGTNFWIVGSQSNLLFKDFVSEVVSRYKDDPRIAWWELANEPNYFSTVWMSRATHSELVAWAMDLAAFIRGVDTNHLIEGGYNNAGSLDMVKFDELNSFLDIASNHIYDMDLYALEAGKGITDRYTAVNDYVQTFTNRAKGVLGLPLLWGEYGADMIAEPLSPYHDWFLEAVYNHDSDAALVWSWEEGYTSDPHVVSPGFRPHVALNLSKWGGIMNTVFDDGGQSAGPEVCPPLVKDVKLNGIQGSINVIPGTPVQVTAVIDDATMGMSNITGANYTIGQGNWASSIPLNAADSSFDSPVEAVTSAPNSIDTAVLGAGLFEICAYASDEKGNDNTTGACQALIVSTDSIEPAVTGFRINGQSALTVRLSSPPSGLSLQVTIDDTSRGDSRIAGAKYSVDGDLAGAQLMDPEDGNFDSSIESAIRSIPVPSAPGARIFCAFGWDAWGNTNTTGQCVIVTVLDDIAPGISVVDSPDPQNSGGTVVFEATATDNAGISEVSIKITDPIGSVMGNSSMNLDVPSGKWIYSSTFTSLGRYSYVAWARDTSSNWASTSGCFDIVQVQDTTPPTISSVQDSPDPQTSGGAVGFEAEVMDDVSVSEVWIEIIDPMGFRTGNFTMSFDTPSGKWEFSSTFTAIGMHSYAIRARDTSNNWASASSSFEIIQVPDITPPTIISVEDSPDPQETGKTVNFKVIAADNVGVTAVMLDIGPGNYSMAFDPGSGEWLHSMTFDTAQFHTYEVWASDAAGTIAGAIGSILIIDSMPSDTTPPQVTLVTAHPVPQFKGKPVLISAVVTDDDNVNSVYVKIVDKNGVVLGNITMAYNDTSGKWERTVIFGSAGSYSLVVWAKDRSGNYGWAPGSLNIINSVSRGMIKGGILDADGKPISGATVSLVDGNGNTVATYVTGIDGTYSFKDITPGIYTVTVLKPGYEPESTEDIAISEGDTADLGSTVLLPELKAPALADGNLMLIALLVLAIAVVALILIILLYRRKKKKVSGDF